MTAQVGKRIKQTSKSHWQFKTYFGMANLPVITHWQHAKHTANDEFYCMTIEEVEDIEKIAVAKGIYFSYYQNSIGYKCQLSKQSLDAPYEYNKGKWDRSAKSRK